MTPSLLTCLIALPLVAGLTCLLVREHWVRGVALTGALLTFLFALWGFTLYSQDAAPGLRDALYTEGGLLDQALDREGLADLVVRERFRELLSEPLPSDEQVTALASELAGVALAEDSLRVLQAQPQPDARALKTAQSLRLGAQREAARLERALRSVDRDLAGLRIAASGPLQGQFKLVEHKAWIAGLGVHYFLAVDGLSASFAVLTALVGLLCLVYTSFGPSTESAERLRRSCVLLLLAEGGLLGILCSLDAVLLFAFWSLVLIPLFLLIGGKQDSPAAAAGVRFLVPGFLGALGLLGAGLTLGLAAPEAGFNLLALAELAREGAIPASTQGVAFACLFAACAVRLPLIPLHGWLPAAQRHLPSEFAAFVQGALLASGGYGLLRLVWPLCPDVFEASAHVTAFGLDQRVAVIPLVLGALALVNLIGGSLLALAARDLRRQLAYVSVAHVGYVLLGLCALTPAAAASAALEILAHGSAAAGACLAIGVVIDRTGDAEIGALGGLARPLPNLSGLSAIFLLSLVGLPGLAGFCSRLLLVLGTWNSQVLPPAYLALTAVALILLGATLVWTLNRTFLGELHRTELANATDLRAGEALALVPLAGACLLLGLAPRVALDALGPSLDAFLNLMSQAR